MRSAMKKITDFLFQNADEQYQKFHCSLIPTIASSRVIGVRTPCLRAFAKQLYKSGDFSAFLNELPHKYYEENNLHAFILEQVSDFDDALLKTEQFLPFIDNWATCDCFVPKCFKKNKKQLLSHIYAWIESEHTYTVRYAVGLLMKLFLDADFDVSYLSTVANIKSDDYYINMMLAWYFQTALAKQYDAAILFLTEKRLPKFVHNKAIQKSVESLRMTKEQKDFLRSLKIK